MNDSLILIVLGICAAPLVYKGARKVYLAAAWWLSVCRDEREWEEASSR